MVTSSAPGVPTFSRRVFAMHDNGYLNLSDHDSFASGVPHETFNRMRKEDPVAWTDGDAETKGFWNLTRHADRIHLTYDQLCEQDPLYSVNVYAQEPTSIHIYIYS